MPGEVALAILATAAVSALWLVSRDPFIPVYAAAGLLALLTALCAPFYTLMLFVIFSIFRLHEVLPSLQPFQLPLLLSVLGLASVGWHLFLSRRLKPYLSPEMTALLGFAIVVSLSALTAKSPPLAYAYWSENFIKLVAITVALCWTMLKPSDFRFASYTIVLCGILVGVVTISNRINGIGLVELTRATVAREFGSPLGDPNILALTLTFPLSFCLSLLLFKARPIDWLLGLIGTGTVIAGIVCTQSRGGLLGILAVLCVTSIRMKRSRMILLPLLPMVAGGLYMMMNLSERVSGGAADVVEESVGGRLYAWSAAINMALDRPLTGVGINNFVSEFYVYTDVWSERALTAHSVWFQVLGENGFPGFALFVIMVVLTFRSALRAYVILQRKVAPVDMQGFAFATTAGVAGFCVAGTFLSEAYNWAFYVLLAFSSALTRWAAVWDTKPDQTSDLQSVLTGKRETAQPLHHL